MLALSFLLLIGVTLIADGFGFHIAKAYIYAAMGFSVFVEALNLRARQPAPAAGRATPDLRQGRGSTPELGSSAARRPRAGPTAPRGPRRRCPVSPW